MNKVEPLTADQQVISEKFTELLIADIEKHGPMPFSEYMQRSLYQQGLGYYVNGMSKFGHTGDFTTAPEISDDFAFCVATQCKQIFDEIGSAEVLEFGGGSGKLSVDIIKACAQLENLPHRYLILDISVQLQHEQRELIEQQLPTELATLVEWRTELPDEFTGVVIANEVLDAFTVERFRVENGLVKQRGS